MTRILAGVAPAFALICFVTAAEPRPHAAKLFAPRTGEAFVEVGGFDPAVLAAVRDAKPTAPELAAACKCVVAEGTAEEVAARPPMAGTWSVAESALRFDPTFPLRPGVKYRVSGDLATLPRVKLKGQVFAVDLVIPKPPPGPPPAITALYPSGDRLPENALRWYVHFSEPMARGNVYRHLKLLRADGTEVVSPFLELDEELWSADGTRLTVFFHPGRVKRELQPREELGPILEAGRTYTLVIDAKWENGDGQPLKAAYRRTFTATAADDQPVRPEDWTLIPPRANTDSPLILRLAKPHDHALLGHMVWVTDAAGKPVEGTVTVGGGERAVTFAPAKPWRRGDYKLAVDTRLEDVCGNRVGEPFEVDVFKPITRKLETKTFERPFAVK